MAQEKGNIVNSTKQFINEVFQELGKVNWSTRKQLEQSTKVVIISTFILAIYLFAADTSFSAVLQWFLNLKL